jgi:hypothetical protein
VLDRKLNWALTICIAVAGLLAVGFAVLDGASANQCGAKCRNAYNQCRITTKGSPTCETAFTSCMQRCIKR